MGPDRAGGAVQHGTGGAAQHGTGGAAQHGTGETAQQAGAGPDPQTIPAALARAAKCFGPGSAIIDGSGTLTYAELSQQVRSVAAALLGEGVTRGDRVAVCCPNTRHWVLAALGAQHAGATLVPVSTRFTGPEMLDVLARSGARVLVIAERFLDTDRLAALRATAEVEGDGSRAGPVPGLAALRLVVRVPVSDPDSRGQAHGGRAGELGWDTLLARAAGGQGLAQDREVDARAAEVGPDDVSDILFTSGTTGRSKGVLSAHRQALAVAAAWAGHAELTAADRYLVVNPFFHSFGYKAGILACLLRGTALIPQARYEPEQAMRLIEAHRVTVLPGPPTLYQTILDHPGRAGYDLSSLRLAVTGAAIVPVALIERMRSELSFRTVLTAYGLTEAVVAAMCRAGDDPQTVARTCGQPAAGFEVRITDRAGRSVPAGEQGEVRLSGPNVMLGYLDDPAATRQAVGPGGWLHTGDVGFLDERGYLTLTDRLKDMYICGGFNVYPAEVEQALARLDGVAESAVVGVPDRRLGEVGKAYIVALPGHDLSAERVFAFCAERLANYKRPRYVEFCTELPRNAAGKVLKTVLRSTASEADDQLATNAEAT